jgi:hypothetical protein
LANYIFQRIAKLGAAGIDKSARQLLGNARTWFRGIRDAVMSVRSVNRNKYMEDSNSANLVTVIDKDSIGSMYSFFYDPKNKKTLPYYDMFPLVFVIGPKPGGFLGINLHYLPPTLRAKLMDELHTIANNTKYDNTTKLVVSYELLSKAARFRYFKPCVKHYLFDHVQSKFLKIEPSFWDTAMMLPTEKFAKADIDHVWNDSRSSVV